MQKWQNYFLNEAKQFGVCVHQKDLDTNEKKYYPFKEQFVTEFFEKNINEKTEQLNKIKNDVNCLKDEYEEMKKQHEEDFYETENYLKQKLANYKECLKKISQLECKQGSVNNSVKISCVSKLKKIIYSLEDQLSRPFEPFMNYGDYIRNTVESFETDINRYKNLIIESNNRIKNQNENINQLYSIVGLNADDFYMKEFDLNELYDLESSHRKRRGGTAPNRALSQDNK